MHQRVSFAGLFNIGFHHPKYRIYRNRYVSNKPRAHTGVYFNAIPTHESTGAGLMDQNQKLTAPVSLLGAILTGLLLNAIRVFFQIRLNPLNLNFMHSSTSSEGASLSPTQLLPTQLAVRC